MTKLAKNISGSLVAIVTPMHADGSLDLPALRQLIDWHIAEGTDGIVIVGTTGESPTVSVEEHCELIKVTVEHTAKRIPIIAGTGGNSTSEAIELTEYAKKVGADASLQVVPYYNKPTQEGMYQHFKTIAEKVDLPVILYNVPGRTVADMANETVIRLAKVPGITGIKDATGNLERGTQLIAGLKAAGAHDFAVYSGDDLTALFLMLMGGQGNISVTANVAPKLMHELCVAAMAGDMARTREIQYKLLAVHKSMFIEANPIPVKWALHAMGRMDSGIRLPLTTLSDASQEQVRQALKAAGLLV
ncbi:4-hydroxy-tetrahydrodipicolinate synthase [Polynucleobacter sp. MWH-Spelu-300-X4]|jgi:4-hydroxy-tetrahydrodipicolinate synthase|uniref:4-hydroxy-tetrahydrodipicolinate synthase n=1 Tax=Polynucleobacter sp. MWH-Spelu-300-X4 TaxID=2689109 RepID=UPI001BFD39A2|nr:4-hydroxy-tetrahydrodipicolinate synthase [Polynucleobacter sp. MWH-Spelu-300-X4]QWD79145.1 4-hydroxy-tetrahydrodipicolinate synthase [Polynucleobacter sp. MWH-Spelu-300-X4]